MNGHAPEAGFMPCSLYWYRWVLGGWCAQLRRPGFLPLYWNDLHGTVTGYNMRRWDSSYWWRHVSISPFSWKLYERYYVGL